MRPWSTPAAGRLSLWRWSATPDKSIDWQSNDNWTSYAEAGFSAVIDPAVMLADDEATAPANWHVLLTVSAGGRTIAAPLTRRDLNGSTGQLPVGPMLGSSRMAVEMRAANHWPDLRSGDAALRGDIRGAHRANPAADC